MYDEVEEYCSRSVSGSIEPTSPDEISQSNQDTCGQVSSFTTLYSGSKLMYSITNYDPAHHPKRPKAVLLHFFYHSLLIILSFLLTVFSYYFPFPLYCVVRLLESQLRSFQDPSNQIPEFLEFL